MEKTPQQLMSFDEIRKETKSNLDYYFEQKSQITEKHVFWETYNDKIYYFQSILNVIDSIDSMIKLKKIIDA